MRLNEWAGFMHRLSRHVPMLAHPGGPKHNEERYIIFFITMGYLQQKSQKTNITTNRVKMTNYFHVFHLFMYGNCAFFLPFSFLNAHTRRRGQKLVVSPALQTDQ